MSGCPRRTTPGTLQIRCLNRLLLEREELTIDSTGDTTRVKAVLTKADPRVKHVRKILKASDGATLRIGLVDAGVEEDAVVRWDHDGDLHLSLPSENHSFLTPIPASLRPPVDLLLALPRPANLAPFLNMATQLGVHRVILCNAAKVQADYFGSHLLKEPRLQMREALKAGLVQAGDTALPEVHVVRRLKPFLNDELAALCPDTLRVFGHPQKEWADPLPAMRDLDLGSNKRILLAVGPEAGWQDPFELDLLREHGFQGVALGERTLRTDVALVSLMAIAHEVLRERARSESSA